MFLFVKKLVIIICQTQIYSHTTRVSALSAAHQREALSRDRTELAATFGTTVQGGGQDCMKGTKETGAALSLEGRGVKEGQ